MVNETISIMMHGMAGMRCSRGGILAHSVNDTIALGY
jgi:hypothetical protein